MCTNHRSKGVISLYLRWLLGLYWGRDRQRVRIDMRVYLTGFFRENGSHTLEITYTLALTLTE